MRTVEQVIALWPTVPDFARDIGITPKHAQTMRARESIPPGYWLDVVRAATERGFKGVSLEVLARIHARERAAS